MIDPQQIKKLKRIVWTYYKQHARADLPWRATRDPYAVLVSEIMLQQTQVVRVRDKFVRFLERFPTPHELANASQAEVLTLWQGLGYNRRALMLHRAAQVVCKNYDGVMPSTYEELVTLPGVGPYTTGAICAFAFGQPVPIVETNIRTVVLHHLLPNRDRVSDREVLALSAALLDRKRPRDWYYALMDYGAHLKVCRVQVNARSAHYAKQSRFAGSNRQIRGAIVRALAVHQTLSFRQLVAQTGHESERVRIQLDALAHDGMVRRVSSHWSL